MRKTLCVLVLIGVTTMIGYSQNTASEYVSPSEALPRGKAPKMQVQLLNPAELMKQYAVIFYQGDEAFSGLLEFAEKYQVTSAHFTAIGPQHDFRGSKSRIQDLIKGEDNAQTHGCIRSRCNSRTSRSGDGHSL